MELTESVHKTFFNHTSQFWIFSEDSSFESGKVPNHFCSYFLVLVSNFPYGWPFFFWLFWDFWVEENLRNGFHWIQILLPWLWLNNVRDIPFPFLSILKAVKMNKLFTLKVERSRKGQKRKRSKLSKYFKKILLQCHFLEGKLDPQVSYLILKPNFNFFLMVLWKFRIFSALHFTKRLLIFPWTWCKAQFKLSSFGWIVCFTTQLFGESAFHELKR